jgi:hypothetical protein
VNPKRISDGDGVVMVMVLVLVMVMERSSFGDRLFRWSTRAHDVCFSWTQPGLSYTIPLTAVLPTRVAPLTVSGTKYLSKH